MRNEILICLLFFLLLWTQKPLMAQYDLDQPSRLIRVEDGLPNHYLRGMTQDANGFVWIGSYDGISRFDGKLVKVFRHEAGDSTTLTQNTVASLAADPNNGQLWVGTFGGLNVYHPSTGHFRTYLHDDQDDASLPSNYVSWLYVDRQSTVWVGSRSNTLCRLDAGQNAFVKYQPEEPAEGDGPETIWEVEQDRSNDSIIWIGTSGRLFSFNKYTTTFDYTHPSFFGVQQIFPQTKGQLLIRDDYGKIMVYQPRTRKIVHTIEPQEGWSFGRIFQKSEDQLWINCNKGIAQLNLKDLEVSYPWVDDPAQEKEYRIDMIDRDGRIWSVSTKGIKIYDPATTQFNNYTYETTGASPPFITQRMQEVPEEEAIYVNVSAGYGVYRFDMRTKEWLHIPPPEAYPTPLFYGSDFGLLQDGQLLILDRKGIYVLSSDGRRMLPHPLSQKLPSDETWVRMFVDSKGFIWLGGLDYGVFKVDPRNWEVTSLAEWLPGCREPRFRWAIYEDSEENIWFSVCGGITFYSYQEDAFHSLLSENNPKNTLKTPKDFVEDQEGILWVSDEAEGLLGAINLQEPEKGIYRKYSFEQNTDEDSFRILKGDPNATLGVGRMTVDGDNNIWTYGPTGLLKIYPDRRGIEIYNDLDGLQWLDEELTVATISQIGTLSTGEIVIGFRKVISIFDPAELTLSQERPQPYLTAFNVYNNPWQSDSSLFATRKINLNYWENYFSFEFSSIGFTNPDHHQYQYKLEGVDEEWISSGQRSYAAYTNVDGGRYTFMVKAANRDGIWNETPLKIDLSVAIPWWQRLWFKGMVVLFILAAVYSFYRYQMHQVRKAERLKSDFENKLAGVELTALRSQMNPHFIFNCLNSIESYIIKNETVKASEYLNDFSRLIRLILQNSRSNYVTIKDELEALKLYMEMENLRLTKSFSYEIKLDESLDPDNTEIPPMLMQPYVENAIWHGLMHKEESGTILVDLKKLDDFLLCTIEDDGVGRKRSSELQSKRHKKTSMGMNITQERIDIINKAYDTETSVRVIDLVSPEGEGIGTRVELRIRLE